MPRKIKVLDIIPENNENEATNDEIGGLKRLMNQNLSLKIMKKLNKNLKKLNKNLKKLKKKLKKLNKKLLKKPQQKLYKKNRKMLESSI